MPTIDQLSQASSIDDADELALFSKANGDTRKVTTLQLAAHVMTAIEGTPDETVYSMVTDGSGFTVVVLPTTPGGSAWAQITLSAPAPTGTIVLPDIDDRAHNQEVLVTCTRTVTTLTVNGNGAALSGAPTTIGPASPFRMRFDSISSTWYRIG
jgi:hypothetical protein